MPPDILLVDQLTHPLFCVTAEIPISLSSKFDIDLYSHKCVKMDIFDGYSADSSSGTKTQNSSHKMSKSQKDSQGKVRDFFEKLILWRDESQKQFFKIVNAHSNNINEAMNSLIEEVGDLQAQLSVTRKERNDLIETVKNMSGKIGKQPDNEDPLDWDSREVGHLETGETAIERPTIGYENCNPEEESEYNEDIADRVRNQPTLNIGDTEDYLTFNDYEEVDVIDMKYEEISENNISQAEDKKAKAFGTRDRIGSNKLLAPGGINPADHDELTEQSEARSVGTEVQTNVALPFFALKREKKSARQNGEKKTARKNGEKKFKCEQCLYTSVNIGNLNQHIAIVHNKVEKKFKCDQCPYASHKNCHLKEHIAAIHDNIRRYACGNCSYVGTYKRALVKHRKTCP